MRWPFWVLTVCYCAGIFWLSSRPAPPTPIQRFPGDDKVAHALLYAGLTAVVSVGMHRSGKSSARRVFYLPLLFAMLYGITDELHQHFVPPRTCDFFDWCADATGALLIQLALFRWAWKARVPWR